jgi:two-component system sensor histidine kinase BarA
VAVDLAASGEEALAMFQAGHYDLVLMDIRMPGMDGVQTTREIRRLEAPGQRLPIVAVTAHVLEEERRHLLQSGLDDVLVKPLDPQTLSRVLHKHLGISPATEPDPSANRAAPGSEDDNLAIVDLRLGAQLANGSGALAEKLLAGLAGYLPESEKAIRDALEEGDDEALLDAVHSLNGACRYIGVPRLALLAETLETRLRTRGREGITPLLEDLFAAMAEVRAWRDPQPSSTTKATARPASSVSER